jgi:DMSO/TMAO reductase YedYZ heme-binding membrane subunit
MGMIPKVGTGLRERPCPIQIEGAAMRERMRLAEWGALNGWTLTGVIALAITVMALTIAAAHQFDTEGMRAVIRATARTSLLLFCLAYTASALHRLWPGPWTRWQRRNRRQLGVAFGASHGVHAVAIVSLVLVAPDLLGAVASPDMLIFGGLGYAVIAAMVVTSFDRTAALIGPRAWRVLHRAGAHFVWISFIVTFGKRTGPHPAYWGFIALLAAAMVLRIVAWRMAARRSVVAAG